MSMGNVVRSALIARRIQDGDDRRMEGTLDTKGDIYPDAVVIIARRPVIVHREAGDVHGTSQGRRQSWYVAEDDIFAEESRLCIVASLL